MSLVRLSSEIAASVSSIGRISVDGEVVDPRRSASGRVYLTIRDRGVQVGAVCPEGRVRHCRTVHGERVRVTGRLEYLAGRGQLQLVAEQIVPVGEGAIAAAIQQARARLAADGLLDRPSRPIPRLPEAVGVVCGGGAAVRADIESVVAARFAGYRVDFVEVPVSGPGASEAVIKALGALNARREVEVVVLARGGGDSADLLVFSDEHLCRAIAASRVPIVSAIGHEDDRPLSDEVADLRCGTPSIAATAVIPSRDQLRAELDQELAEADRVWARKLDESALRLSSLDLVGSLRAAHGAALEQLRRWESALEHVDPLRQLALADERLGRVRWREPLSMRLREADAALMSRLETLDALDPSRVLERGYAVVRDSDGVVVRDSRQVGHGDEIGVTLSKGALHAQVSDAAHDAAPLRR